MRRLTFKSIISDNAVLQIARDALRREYGPRTRFSLGGRSFFRELERLARALAKETDMRPPGWRHEPAGREMLKQVARAWISRNAGRLRRPATKRVPPPGKKSVVERAMMRQAYNPFVSGNPVLEIARDMLRRRYGSGTTFPLDPGSFLVEWTRLARALAKETDMRPPGWRREPAGREMLKRIAEAWISRNAFRLYRLATNRVPPPGKKRVVNKWRKGADVAVGIVLRIIWENKGHKVAPHLVDVQRVLKGITGHVMPTSTIGSTRVWRSMIGNREHHGRPIRNGKAIENHPDFAALDEKTKLKYSAARRRKRKQHPSTDG